MKGCTHIYCGDGKGKTTAAMGLAIRAAANDQKVIIIQFLKGGPTGELKILLSQPNITILRGKPNTPFTWNMTEEQKKAALEAGKQGMKNAYEKSGTRPGLTWWERLLWVVLAGAAYAASSLLSGCGHTVDVTAERAEICRDDSCLVLEPGHLSYSQKQPKTEMPPVIRKIRQGK